MTQSQCPGAIWYVEPASPLACPASFPPYPPLPLETLCLPLVHRVLVAGQYSSTKPCSLGTVLLLIKQARSCFRVVRIKYSDEDGDDEDAGDSAGRDGEDGEGDDIMVMMIRWELILRANYMPGTLIGLVCILSHEFSQQPNDSMINSVLRTKTLRLRSIASNHSARVGSQETCSYV